MQACVRSIRLRPSVGPALLPSGAPVSDAAVLELAGRLASAGLIDVLVYPALLTSAPAVLELAG